MGIFIQPVRLKTTKILRGPLFLILTSETCFSKLDIFFKKNEEVIWSQYFLTYLLKLGERGPSVFLVIFNRTGRI
jgi:hypothetical protein